MLSICRLFRSDHGACMVKPFRQIIYRAAAATDKPAKCNFIDDKIKFIFKNELNIIMLQTFNLKPSTHEFVIYSLPTYFQTSVPQYSHVRTFVHRHDYLYNR